MNFITQPHEQKSCRRQTECSNTLWGCGCLCNQPILCCLLQPFQMRYFVLCTHTFYIPKMCAVCEPTLWDTSRLTRLRNIKLLHPIGQLLTSLFNFPKKIVKLLLYTTLTNTSKVLGLFCLHIHFCVPLIHFIFGDPSMLIRGLFIISSSGVIHFLDLATRDSFKMQYIHFSR